MKKWRCHPLVEILYLCVFSIASSSIPSSRVASWINKEASFPVKTIFLTFEEQCKKMFEHVVWPKRTQCIAHPCQLKQHMAWCHQNRPLSNQIYGPWNNQRHSYNAGLRMSETKRHSTLATWNLCMLFPIPVYPMPFFTSLKSHFSISDSMYNFALGLNTSACPFKNWAGIILKRKKRGSQLQ